MGRHLNWYLVELQRSLRGRVTGSQLAETINEVEAHILDDAEELAPHCLHGEDPERLAVERFGSPRRVASEIGEHVGTPLYWEAAKAPAIWCFVLALWFTLATDPGAVALGAVIGLVGFWFACRKGMRFVPGALALAVAAAFVLAVPYLAATRGKGGTGERVVEVVGYSYAPDGPSFARDVATLRRGLVLFDARKAPKIKSGFEFGSGYLPPALALLPPAARTGRSLTWPEARVAWNRDGKTMLSKLAAQQRVASTPHLEHQIVRTGGDVEGWFSLVAVIGFLYWCAMVFVNYVSRLVPTRGNVSWLSRAT